MKDAKEMYLWLTRKLNKKVNLITNGMLINDEWGENLVLGSEWIQISVNAANEKTHELVNSGSKFKKVISSINTLLRLRRKFRTKTEIIFHYTIIPQNIREIPKAIKLAEKLGCDEISYSYDPSVIQYLNREKGLKELLRRQLPRFLESQTPRINMTKDRLYQLGLLSSV